MKLAIMQPYFFPYMGYFQLIHSVDKFVVYDDVNFIKGGWINRNYILTQSGRTRLTLQLLGASSNKPINQIDVGGNKMKLIKTIDQSYAKAPYYDDVMPLIQQIINFDEANLARYLCFGLRAISDYLGIDTDWVISSELDKDNSLKGQDKVLEICETLGAKQYINMPGGKSLYDHVCFAEQNIELSFIEPQLRPYPQQSMQFVPSLSVIDVMLSNSQLQCREMVKEYELV